MKKLPMTLDDIKVKMMSELYFLGKDCELVIQVIQKDGIGEDGEFANLDLMKRHLNEYERLCKRAVELANKK